MKHATKKPAIKKKPAPVAIVRKSREIAAGEFKAKCLAILDEVNETGHEIVITKRGKPKAKLVPITAGKKRKSLLGSMEGRLVTIGDPDDLINPVFPLEAYDMLK